MGEVRDLNMIPLIMCDVNWMRLRAHACLGERG